MPYCRDSALERGETPLLRSPDLHVDPDPDQHADQDSEEEEWLVIMRFGKYCGFRKQGIHWVLPFVDKTVRVKLSKVSPRWKETPDQILETKVHEWVSARL